MMYKTDENSATQCEEEDDNGDMTAFGNGTGNEDDNESDGDDDGDDGLEDDDDDEDTDGLDDDVGDPEEEEDEILGTLKRKVYDEAGAPAKIAKTDDKHLYKIPTIDELNMLRETQTLYHSNLFRMQMEELLLEASMKDKHRFQLMRWFNQFSSFVKSLSSSPVYTLDTTKWMKEKNLVDPLILPEGKGSFQFMAPSDVKFVGSFAAGTSVTTDKTVDVMLVLPKEIVKYKDYKDGKWLLKRARYLAWLASELQQASDIVDSLHWTTHLGETSRPVLQVVPSGGIGKRWKINLLPVPDPESMRLSFFSPEKWTVTPAWYRSDQSIEEDNYKPTPHCNWACAIDMVMQDHLQLITNNISQHKNLVQGIKLIKIWFAQRGFTKGCRKISGHLVTMLVIHLIQTRKIHVQMSGYQAFRTVILTLESSNWSMKGVCMKRSNSEDEVPSLEMLHSLYKVVFMDPTGRVNLAANLLSDDCYMVSHEAQLALQILDLSTADSFEDLFIKKVEFTQVCDQIVSLRLNKKDLRNILKKHKEAKQESLDHLGDLRHAAWSRLLITMRKGLGDRVALITTARDTAVSEWPISDPPPTVKSSLVVGFVINEASAKALLTKGPSAEDPETEKFRSFWGEKSNLRRFQDGSFHEAILWGNAKQPVADRRLIPGEIIKYVLNFHYGIEEDNIHYVCSQVESILRLPHLKMSYEYGTGEESTAQAIQAYDSLTRKLRSLDLPLNISSVQSTSDVCKHTRVFPPIAKDLSSTGKDLQKDNTCKRLIFSKNSEECPLYNYAINVNVFLETSGKWPDDFTAIQAIKAEFYRKMAIMLGKQKTTVIAFPKYLQVLWEGYIFHIKVCYRKEIYLRRLVENSDGDYREQDTEAAINLERDVEILPKITSALGSVQADHPSFNGGVRLAKRWLSSQLLIPHIPHMAVELLVAHLYTSPTPYSAPHTPHVLFLRFLALLAHTDWKTFPILLNLRDNFAMEDITELNRRFTSERESLPNMFIATPYEIRGSATKDDVEYRYKLSSMWTKESPSLPILYRCKLLATASLDIMSQKMMKSSWKVKTMFRPSLDDFDVIITLKRSQLSRRRESLDHYVKDANPVKPYIHSDQELMPIVMFDAAELYLKELRAAFDHFALFFHDEHGGDVIGIVWKPFAMQEQELKISNFEGHRMIGIKSVKQIPNMKAILSDFEIMGQGLVESVVVNEKK